MKIQTKGKKPNGQSELIFKSHIKAVYKGNAPKPFALNVGSDPEPENKNENYAIEQPQMKEVKKEIIEKKIEKEIHSGSSSNNEEIKEQSTLSSSEKIAPTNKNKINDKKEDLLKDFEAKLKKKEVHESLPLQNNIIEDDQNKNIKEINPEPIPPQALPQNKKKKEERYNRLDIDDAMRVTFKNETASMPHKVEYSSGQIKKPNQFSARPCNIMSSQANLKPRVSNQKNGRVSVKRPARAPWIPLDKQEVMCSKCNKMVPICKIEQHSEKCFYSAEVGNAKQAIEDKVSTMHRVNCTILKLRKCMEKSEVIKEHMKSETLTEILALCKEIEELEEASDKTICIIREAISKMLNIKEALGKSADSTTFQYLERLTFCFKIKNGELGKIYNHTVGSNPFIGGNASTQSVGGDRDSSFSSNPQPIQGGTEFEFNKESSSDLSDVIQKASKGPRSCASNTSIKMLSAEQIKTMNLKREFFGIYDEIKKGFPSQDIKIQCVDRDKLFEFAIKSITKDKWQKFVIDELKNRPDKWQNEKKRSRLEKISKISSNGQAQKRNGQLELIKEENYQ